MRAGTNIMRAVSAVALSSTVLAAATLGAQLAAVSVAEAAEWLQATLAKIAAAGGGADEL